MPELTDLSYVRALCEKYDFALSKGFGQNFIINPGLPLKIVDASGVDRRYGVIEIGPGIGVLTKELAKRAAKVVSIEVDERLPPLLAETMAGVDNFKLVLQDVLKVDLRALIEEEFPGMPVAVCANLPYYITTPILSALLEADCFDAVTVMVQKEVAQRIAADPGTGDYGAFSVFCQYYTEPKLLFDVPPSCFLPQPKVTSAVITLRRRETRPWDVADQDIFFRVVRSSFAMRRKKLSNGLASGFPELGKQGAEDVLRACGFPENVRGETLGIPEFARIANEIVRRREVK